LNSIESPSLVRLNEEKHFRKSEKQATAVFVCLKTQINPANNRRCSKLKLGRSEVDISKRALNSIPAFHLKLVSKTNPRFEQFIYFFSILQ
jgi:hypothetical protein